MKNLWIKAKLALVPFSKNYTEYRFCYIFFFLFFFFCRIFCAIFFVLSFSIVFSMFSVCPVWTRCVNSNSSYFIFFVAFLLVRSLLDIPKHCCIQWMRVRFCRRLPFFLMRIWCDRIFSLCGCRWFSHFIFFCSLFLRSLNFQLQCARRTLLEFNCFHLYFIPTICFLLCFCTKSCANDKSGFIAWML